MQVICCLAHGVGPYLWSDLVLACGADRSLQVMDLNQDTVAAQVPEAHSRAAHHITQNQVSLWTGWCIYCYSSVKSV